MFGYCLTIALFPKHQGKFLNEVIENLDEINWGKAS
jgi:hypothetical protein